MTTRGGVGGGAEISRIGEGRAPFAPPVLAGLVGKFGSLAFRALVRFCRLELYASRSRSIMREMINTASNPRRSRVSMRSTL